VWEFFFEPRIPMSLAALSGVALFGFAIGGLHALWANRVKS